MLCQGNAGIVFDTHPDPATHGDLFTIMFVGHADKIRMQVRHISSDGKIYINSGSFLPLTLIGNQVALFSEQSGGAAADGGQAAYKKYSGTVEALGAIHFADAKVRTGAKGIKPEELVRVACRTIHKGTGHNTT